MVIDISVRNGVLKIGRLALPSLIVSNPIRGYGNYTPLCMFLQVIAGPVWKQITTIESEPLVITPLER